MTNIIKKEILGASVEIALDPRAFDTFELVESVGKIGPYELNRSALGHPNYTLRGEGSIEMRIDLKAVLMKCAEELHAMVQARDAEKSE